MLAHTSDRSNAYDRCIQLTRHDIDIARINHFQVQQQANTTIAEFIWRLKNLKARFHAAENRSEEFKSRMQDRIEAGERLNASHKRIVEQGVTRAESMIDKLVKQLANLQGRREKQNIQDELRRQRKQKVRLEQKKEEQQKKRALRRKKEAES